MNDEKQWNETVERLRRGLPVNEELKQELRESLLQEHNMKGKRGSSSIDTVKRHRSRWKFGALAIAIAGLCLFSTLWLSQRDTDKVEAASLHLFDQFSFDQQLGRENSAGMAEYEGTIYLPLNEDGLYVLSSSEYNKLIDGNINFVRVSPDGTQLVYVQEGSLYLYNIADESSRLLLLGGSDYGLLETPAWSPDGRNIMFVSRTQLKNEIDRETESSQGQIYELSLDNGTVRSIVKGQYPSYVAGQNGLFFERDHQIIYRDLKRGEEKVLDSGRYPAVSNDGSYVAYIKSQGDPVLEDVWIADTNFNTKKQMTQNELADAWENGELVEGKQQARYTFEQPTWSHDDQRLFVYKVFHTNTVFKKLVRFQIAASKPGPEDIVAGSIKALIYRDEEFAHTFFNYDPGYLKGTSPRQIGYRILGNGEVDGKTYVDAETYLSYLDPYYEIDKVRYVVTDTPTGYKISDMLQLDNITVAVWGDAAYRVVEGEKQGDPLMELKDIPHKGTWENGKLWSLLHVEEDHTLWFTVTRASGDQSELGLLRYDMESKQFTEVCTIEGASSSYLLQLDDTRQNVAISTELNGKPDLVIYHLPDHKMTILSEQIMGVKPKEVYTRFWNHGKLIFYADMDGREVFFSFDPQSGEVSAN
ncbi:PD40 domain-containing protein [Paenibacillus segetis]|uniref:Uncharacterized protein n=1 Tax=Paenibacillus segetis TaxID=1325360 RepID=A0ABQ1YTX9_9BACL|nr:PD40 domain-containing protein [Paenibacillus segetis]GGH37562.1 hypothetical protein GCM10008013_45110 [Paenibacillus segetis]